MKRITVGRKPLPAALLLTAALLFEVPSIHADERDISNRWLGAWATTNIDVQSGCGDRYTNNDVVGQRSTSNGEFSFDSGELFQVSKVKVERKRIEVLLDLDEPLLAPRLEGPFELFDELDCKVELRIQLPNDIDRKDDAQIETLLTELFARYESAHAARASSTWNGREHDPYPEDYEATLAEY